MFPVSIIPVPGGNPSIDQLYQHYLLLSHVMSTMCEGYLFGFLPSSEHLVSLLVTQLEGVLFHKTVVEFNEVGYEKLLSIIF